MIADTGGTPTGAAWSRRRVFVAARPAKVPVRPANGKRSGPPGGTGGPFTEDAAGVRAEQTVFHDAERPSRVLLSENRRR